MDITITGRGVGIPDRFEDYATEKAEKVGQLAEKALALEIKLVRHHETNGSSGDDRVELTLIGPGPVVRAEAGAADKYAAFDMALDKMIERIRQAKDRKKVHRGQHRPTSLGEATSNGRVLDVVPASADLGKPTVRRIMASKTSIPAWRSSACMISPSRLGWGGTMVRSALYLAPGSARQVSSMGWRLSTSGAVGRTIRSQPFASSLRSSESGRAGVSMTMKSAPATAFMAWR